MDKLSIKELPAQDRPYEKFEKLGAKSLTDAELLAAIIKNGSKKYNCLDIARIILSNHENGLSGFKYLEQASLEELKQISGIGKVKAIQLKCVMELANRINASRNLDNRNKITCSTDVYNLLYNEISMKQVEEVYVVILDSKCFVKSVAFITRGATNKSVISPKEVLTEPIKQLASSIILVHNHPSGDTTPSRQDILLTRKINDYARIFEISLLDHIIIGKNGFTSMKETNSSIFTGGNLI